MKIVLPWPDKRLSPNARGHWASLHKAKKQARWDASYATYEAMNGQAQAFRASFDGDAPIPLRVVFVPPDRRHYDLDNLIASTKALTDGIADALGVNDRRFRGEYVFAEPEKPGRVEVTL